MSASVVFFPNKDTMTHEVFTTNSTWIVPDGINHVLLIGAGGGGGGASGTSNKTHSISGRGGYGAVPIGVWVFVTPGEVISWTLGGGGAGGNPSGNTGFNRGGNGGDTVVNLTAQGNTVIFSGAPGGDIDPSYLLGRTHVMANAGGDRLNSGGKQFSSEPGRSSRFASGGNAGANSPGIGQAFDAGGSGGGAGYGAGGNGGQGGDAGAPALPNPTSGTNGGLSAGGGGGGANGTDDTGVSGGGGAGGPGVLIIAYSSHK